MSEDNSEPTKKDSISPEVSQIPPILDEAANLYLDPKPQTKKKQSSVQLFTVAKSADTETLLANLSETLASANAMLGDLAFDLEDSRRHFALGVQQMIELGELLANRALDIVEPRL